MVFAARPKSAAFTALLTASRKGSAAVATLGVASRFLPAVATGSFNILPTNAATAIAKMPVTIPTTMKVDRSLFSNPVISGCIASILFTVSMFFPLLATTIFDDDSSGKFCCAKVLPPKVNSSLQAEVS